MDDDTQFVKDVDLVLGSVREIFTDYYADKPREDIHEVSVSPSVDTIGRITLTPRELQTYEYGVQYATFRAMRILQANGQDQAAELLDGTVGDPLEFLMNWRSE
jgi:hypothetical protein